MLDFKAPVVLSSEMIGSTASVVLSSEMHGLSCLAYYLSISYCLLYYVWISYLS